MDARTTNEPAAQCDRTPADLLPGDVLLAKGAGALSRVIAFCDGGRYSHAALWSGSGVIEATGKGIHETELYQEFDVYRAKNWNADLAREVVAAARASIGRPYAYTELLLLGLLFSIGVRPSRPVLAEAIAHLGSKAELLERWIDGVRNSRTEPRVCSELVASSYAKAGERLVILPRHQRVATEPHDAAALEALSDRESSTAEAESVEELLTLSCACTGLLGSPPREEEEEEEAVSTVLVGNIAVDPKGNALSVVTPADLQFSSSLQFKGRVGNGRKPAEPVARPTMADE